MVRGSGLLGTLLALNGTGLQAQNWATLHPFSALTNGTNEDGVAPYVSLILANGTLYGTAAVGGLFGGGTIYSLDPVNNHFSTIHHFADSANDGNEPYGALTLAGGVLYGTTAAGGMNGSGAVFAASTDAQTFSLLHSFAATGYSSAFATTTNLEGYQPMTGLALAEGTLYGAACYGGRYGNGTIFAVGTNGQNFRVLHTFTATDADTLSNSDGAYPESLIYNGGQLYGVTWQGGANGSGVVFSINPANSNFVTLHAFAALVSDDSRGGFTNQDGMSPNGGLALAGGTLYGATVQGGTNGLSGGYNAGAGTLYALQTNGTGFHVLYQFAQVDTNTLANETGANPYSSLCLQGNQLYGTTTIGGSGTNGTIFAVNTNGTSFTVLHAFARTPGATNTDGALAYAGLVLSGIRLYGTAYGGGPSGNGCVFEVDVQPRMTTCAATGQDVTLHGANAVAGEPYRVLISPTLTNALRQWTPWVTNVPGSGGDFTITLTNAASAHLPAQFIILQAQ